MLEPGSGSMITAAIGLRRLPLDQVLHRRRQCEPAVADDIPSSSHRGQRAAGAKTQPGISGSKYSRNQGSPVAEVAAQRHAVIGSRRAMTL